MIICLGIGNTHIYGGVFVDDEIQLRFRYPATIPCTSDIFGIFLKEVLAKNGLGNQQVQAISICSVVPALDYSVVAACKKYFSLTPFELKPGVKTGIKLAIKNPLELGANRVANAVAATHHFPNRNLIITDFGTATCLCAIAKDKTYLGGAILPGIKLSMKSLSEKTAKISDVEIAMPESVLGKSTVTQLQSGLLYGQLGAIKEISQRIHQSVFQGMPAILISTGGFAHLFEQEKYFTINVPDLILHGLRLICERNKP